MNHKASQRELAGDRTDLAEDRTLLANERTFSSWMRTALAAVGVGVGSNALLRTFEPPWVAKAIATAFVMVGVLIFWAAERRVCRVQRQLSAQEIAPFTIRRLRIIALAMAIAALAFVGALWLVG